MKCPQCNGELPLVNGYSRVWYCQDCEVTIYMTYGRLTDMNAKHNDTKERV